MCSDLSRFRVKRLENKSTELITGSSTFCFWFGCRKLWLKLRGTPSLSQWNVTGRSPRDSPQITRVRVPDKVPTEISPKLKGSMTGGTVCWEIQKEKKTVLEKSCLIKCINWNFNYHFQFTFPSVFNTYCMYEITISMILKVNDVETQVKKQHLLVNN